MYKTIPADPDQNHFLRIHVVYPTLGRQSRVPDYRSMTGHTFISLGHPEESEKYWGFNPAYMILGRESVDPAHHINGPADWIKPVQGIISDESRYFGAIDTTIDYPVTRDQYDRACQRINDWQQDTPTYVLAQRNCVTFACDIVTSIGISPPAQIMLIDTPVGTGLGIRLQKWRNTRIQKAEHRARNSITA